MSDVNGGSGRPDPPYGAGDDTADLWAPPTAPDTPAVATRTYPVTGGTSASADKPDRTRRRVPIRAGIAVIVVAALIVVGVVIGRHTTGGTATPPSTLAATTTVPPTTTVAGFVPASGGTYTDASGVTVDVPAGSLDGPATVGVTPTGPPQALDPIFETVGPLVDVAVTGANLTGPINVTVPITDTTALDPIEGPDGKPSGATATFYIGHWNGTGWELLDTTVDPQARTATATLTSLSPIILVSIGRFVRDFVVSLAQQITGGLYTDIPEPDCGAGTDDRAAWTVDTDELPVSWCATLRDDGTRFVQVANRRRYGITVTVTGGSVEGASTDLASQLSQFASRPGVIALAPGETADVTIPAGATAGRITSEYDGMAQTLTTMLTAADILAFLSTKVPFANSKTAKQFLHELDIVGCAKSSGVDIVAAALNAASTIAKLITSCWKLALKNVGGLVAKILEAPLVIVASTLAYFVSAGSALVDLLTGGSSGKLLLDTTGATAPSGPLEQFAGSWTGPVTQEAVSPYHINMVLTVSGDTINGTTDYPDHPCGGTATFVSVAANVLTLREDITHGDGCVTTGEMTFTLLTADTGSWTFTGGGVTASAPLTRGTWTDTGTGTGASAWPTGDNEGPAVYFTWLGADLLFPSWTSCSPDYCLAGHDSSVLVTSLHPLNDLGEIPQSTADPLAALVALGVPAASATTTLKPG